ncbi:MAG: hypothetical protein J6P05_01795 [Lachnospiraceae bacterium]|nr:hypothetical protein [Lachnospiraceae bacterium]
MPNKPFRSAETEANDLKSSGYALTIVGAVGFFLTILSAAGFLPVRFLGAGRFISYGTMMILFIAFTIIGVRSLMRVPGFYEEARREKKKIEEIERWFLDNYPASVIDEDIESLPGSSEWMMSDRYYARIDYMKEKINARFMDLDPSFQDYLTEDIYHKCFEEGG